MATQYTNILKLALPVQGELSGTWGDVVNDNITEMVEEAIAGRKVINTWTANSHTLTTADGTTSESRAAILTLTDTGTALTGAGTVICPANSKVYIVENGAGQTITVKTSSGTGVAVPNGKNMVVFCDGTNVEESITNINSLTLNGDGATVSSIKDEDNMASNSATALATQQSIKAYVDSQVATADTLAEVLANGNTTGGTDIAVGTGDDITFADSSKAIFGAGSDLQIYHDGTNSYISDQGTNDLKVLATDFQLKNAADNEFMMTAVTDGAVTAYFNGSAKIATTNTGIDVTGSVVSDGLTVNGDVLFEGAVNDVIVNSSTNSYPFYVSRGVVKTEALAIGVDDSDAILNSIQDERYGGYKFQSTYSGTGTRTRMQIGQNTGDISFYNDAGTSQDFYWDASESRLGLGTMTPAHEIHIRSASPQIRFSDSDGTNTYGDLQYSGVSFNIISRGGASAFGAITFARTDGTSNINTAQINAAGDYRFYDDTGTEGMRWDASTSRLGIGTSVPETNLHVHSTGNTLAQISSSFNGSTTTGLYIDTTGDTSKARLAFQKGGATIGVLGFNHASSATNEGYTFSTSLGTRALLQGDGLRIYNTSGGVSHFFTYNENGGEIQLIDETGNVGTLIDEVSSASRFLQLVNGSVVQIGLGSSNTTGNVQFIGGGSEWARFTSAGRLGIATTNPQAQVHAVADGAYTPAYYAQNDGSAASWARMDFYNDQASNTGIIYRDQGGNFAFRNDNSSGTAKTTQIIAGNTTAGHIAFYTTVSSEAMRVESSGEVGIGTATPSAKLHVYDGTTNNIIKSHSGSGYAAFQTLASGTNTSYIFFNNASGETGRIASVNGGTMAFYNNGTQERMRITSAGDVGIGTASPRYNAEISSSGSTFLQIASTSTSALTGLLFGDTSNAVGRVTYDHSNNSLAFFTNTTEKMRVTSAGNFGINNSTPDSTINVKGQAKFGDTTDATQIRINASSSSGIVEGNAPSGLILRSNYVGSLSHIVFNTNGTTEAMRIRHDQIFLYGTTSVGGEGGITFDANKSNGAAQQIFNRASTTSTSVVMRFRNGGTNVGQISHNNTTTSYITTSDARLKSNIVDAPSASDDIDAMQVRSFDWIGSGEHQKYGMIAQELQTVAPDAVAEGDEEDDIMGVDYSKLVPMLIKEIQSLRARVARLEDN